MTILNISIAAQPLASRRKTWPSFAGKGGPKNMRLVQAEKAKSNNTKTYNLWTWKTSIGVVGEITLGAAGGRVSSHLWS